MTGHVLRRATFGLSLLALAAAGCTGAPAGPTPTLQPIRTAVPGPTTTGITDTCTLIPAGDVTAIASYPVAFDRTEQDATGDNCTYYYGGSHDGGLIGITIVPGMSGDDVEAEIQSAIDNAKSEGLSSEQLAGPGDEAWWFPGTVPWGQSSLILGRGTIELAIGDTDLAQVYDATAREGLAVKLANYVLGKLP